MLLVVLAPRHFSDRMAKASRAQWHAIMHNKDLKGGRYLYRYVARGTSCAAHLIATAGRHRHQGRARLDGIVLVKQVEEGMEKV